MGEGATGAAFIVFSLEHFPHPGPLPRGEGREPTSTLRLAGLGAVAAEDEVERQDFRAPADSEPGTIAPALLGEGAVDGFAVFRRPAVERDEPIADPSDRPSPRPTSCPPEDRGLIVRLHEAGRETGIG